MIAEVITIGDELLIGQVVDTNSAWMAEQLNLVGVKIRQIISISDDEQQILKTLDKAAQNADVVLITGGLGPTKDDITKTALCKYFHSELVFNQKAYENVERIFAKRNIPVTELNRQQAMVPEACTVLENVNGTAPGMMFSKGKVLFVSMPGVPFEMKGIMQDHVLPMLKQSSNLKIRHRTILTEGIGESFLAAKIESWEDDLPDFIKLAYLPQPGIVRLRLTAQGEDDQILERELNCQSDKLYKLIPEFIFGEDDDTLQEIIGKLLKSKNAFLATAESCTGGYVAHLITGISGSSDYFKGSVVAYSNEIKEKILAVSSQTLEMYGAVSEETVKEMSQNLLEVMNVDYAIATSGIAGPTGGTDEKPVGTTWIAVCSKNKVVAKKYLFGEHRGRNIHRSAITTLNMLRKLLMEEQG